jgi:hypothetical protein
VGGMNESGYIWKMGFISIYENKRMKPTEIVLGKTRG